MKRSALGEWRCAGATSPGRRYWTATESVCVLVRSGTPGLARRRIRLSVPCPGATKSALRRSSGSISAQRQTHGWTCVFFDSMSGPGRDQGASRPAACTSARYCSSSWTERTACRAMLFWTSNLEQKTICLETPLVLERQTRCVNREGCALQSGSRDEILRQDGCFNQWNSPA